MITVALDLANPGQYFACCGLMELAHRLCPDVEGWFDEDSFHLSLQERDIQSLFDCLLRSEIKADDQRGEARVHPVRFEDFGLTLDWWLNLRGKTTHLKLWAGNQTSLGIVESLIEAIRGVSFACVQEAFDFNKPLSGRFGVDPRGAWNTRDAGYSPNEQQMEATTYPVIELLAAFGLQGFRPRQLNGQFQYSTWNVRLPAIPARAAASGVLLKGNSYKFWVAQRGSYKAFTFATTNTGSADGEFAATLKQSYDY